MRKRKLARIETSISSDDADALISDELESVHYRCPCRTSSRNDRGKTSLSDDGEKPSIRFYTVGYAI